MDEERPIAEHRVDELARLAGTTVRNVRAYQDRGLLPPPRREGRVGLYSEAHLARLRIIGGLLERGFTLQNIAELLEAWERGRPLGDLLGLEVAVASPFSDEVPTYTTVAELVELLGPPGPDDAPLIAEVLRLGLVELDGDQIKVPSPRTLQAGAELIRAGIPPAEVLAHAGAIRDDMDRVAARLVDLVITHVFDRYDDGLPPAAEAGEVAALLQRLRPLAEMVVDAELARGLEHHVTARLGERLEHLLEAREDAAS
jgi:DNA-binding transcriptional MerR regulator